MGLVILQRITIIKLVQYMEFYSSLPYLSALVVGFVMGLLGGGGSILTIPIFVYMFGISPVLATAYSLFVVGATATVGTIRNFQQNIIHLSTGLLFGIPSFIGTYITRRYILPSLPKTLMTIGDFDLTLDLFIMMLFATMMLMASVSMISNKTKEDESQEIDSSKSVTTIVLGFVIGLLTGFIGAGGGFIIVPALIFLTRLPVKIAIGTSLFIIMMKSFIGFLGDLQTVSMDWRFLIIFSILSAIGIIVGIQVAKRTKAKNLKTIFGWFILVVGIYVVFKEVSGL